MSGHMSGLWGGKRMIRCSTMGDLGRSNRALRVRASSAPRLVCVGGQFAPPPMPPQKQLSEGKSIPVSTTNLLDLVQPYLPLSKETSPLMYSKSPRPHLEAISVGIYHSFASLCKSTIEQKESWRTNWPLSVAFFIITSFRTTRFLHLYALRGDAKCGQEVDFVCAVLKLLGFDEGKEQRCRHHDDDGGVLSVNWSWLIERDGVSPPFEVHLHVYTSLDAIDCNGIAALAAPRPACARSPNLFRVACVSAPADRAIGLEERVRRGLRIAAMKAKKERAAFILPALPPKGFAL